MEFLGLLVMENRLKPETKPVIDLLNRVNIRVIMCTGDNILTGLCVAKNCNIINENNVIVMVDAQPQKPPTFEFLKLTNKKLNEIKTPNYQVSVGESVFTTKVINSFFSRKSMIRNFILQ